MIKYMDNIINQILIIIILFFLINYLTDGKIIEFIKKAIFYKKSDNNNFVNTSYPDIDKLDENSFNLYRYLNNMVSFDTNDATNKSPKIMANSETIKYIISNINKIFNSKGYIFSNINIIDKLYFYQSYKGKDFIPFNFQTNISYNNNNLGNYTINMKCFLREDKDYYEIKKTGYLVIQNIKLISTPTNKPSNESYELTNTIKENFTQNDNNIDVDINDFFIKKKVSFNEENETENSLIPTIVDV